MITAVDPNYIEVFVSGEIRRITRAVWDGMQGPKPDAPTAFVCNGCTLWRDYFLGKPVWPACVLHDYHTSVYSDMDREDADALLRENVKFVLKAHGLFTPIAHAYATLMHRGVRRGGRKFYRGNGDPR